MKLLNVLFKVSPWFIIAFFWCKVDPEKVYTWYDGLWQGAYSIPNWIISFFQDDRLCKAVEYTSSYNILWWVLTVFSAIYFFFLLLGVIMILLGKAPKQA